MLQSDKSVLDVAFKYGYETPESFSKAFKRFHGINPRDIECMNYKKFKPLKIQIEIKGGFVMKRKLIPNIMKIYEIPSENYMFDSCMSSVMAALGESKELDFNFFAGITGDLFVQTWKEPKWQYNDEYSSIGCNMEEPIAAAFKACGYEYECVQRTEIEKNKSFYLEKIVESIDHGYPVLTFGIVGPPTCSIICGYDEDGDVLIGYSQFTDETKEENPMDLYTADKLFQTKNGLDRSEKLIFIKGKVGTPQIADCFRNAILNVSAIASLQTSQNGTLYFGKKAFDMWAGSLLTDEDFTNEDDLLRPLDTYGSCIVMIGTNMHYMQTFFDRAAVYCPEIEMQITRLRNAFQNVSRALDDVTTFQGGYFFDADRKALLKKDFRAELSRRIIRLGECYDEAIKVLDF